MSVECKPRYLDSDIYLIDQMELGIPEKTGTYLILSEHVTLVDTGASPAVPRILEGLRHVQLSPEDVRYVVVTHIHLDHAGGAGLLMKKCPNAQLIVHPRGFKHMKDPAKLIASAKSVFGDRFQELYDPIVPVPEARIQVMDDGEKLSLGSGRTLEFRDTPGHAMHHFAIYDTASEGVFTGDTVGIRYPYFEELGFTYYLPAATPTQFNLALMQESWETILEWNPKRFFFGHFGMSENIEDVMSQIRTRTPYFVDIAEKSVQMGEDETGVFQRLMQTVREEWRQLGVPDTHPAFRVLEYDLDLNAQGLYYAIQHPR